METKLPFYIQKMKEGLSQKQRTNSQYSLRAYARDIGVHHATLAQVLKGNRHLPLKSSEQVAKKLNLGPKEKTLFMESLLRKRLSLDSIKIDELDQRFMLDESFYKVIAEWEHAAVIELFNVEDFTRDAADVAFRLKIAKNRAEVVLENLFTCGLVVNGAGGKLDLAHPDLRTTEDVTNPALRDSHIETLKMGIDKLDEIEVELRDFSSATVALNLDKLPEAKTIIREFRMKMTALLRDGDPKTDVYQLAIQFYPLTDVTKN